jgi:hypothetical protein
MSSTRHTKVWSKPCCSACVKAGKSNKEAAHQFETNGKITCPMVRARGCTYCKESDHVNQECPKLAEKRQREKYEQDFNKMKNYGDRQRRANDYRQQVQVVPTVATKVATKILAIAQNESESESENESESTGPQKSGPTERKDKRQRNKDAGRAKGAAKAAAAAADEQFLKDIDMLTTIIDEVSKPKPKVTKTWSKVVGEQKLPIVPTKSHTTPEKSKMPTPVPCAPRKSAKEIDWADDDAWDEYERSQSQYLPHGTVETAW